MTIAAAELADHFNLTRYIADHGGAAVRLAITSEPSTSGLAAIGVPNVHRVEVETDWSSRLAFSCAGAG